jgi:signal transduction histidine kinase
MDKSVRLSGLPTIRVLRRLGDREITVQLDPVYGRGNDRASEPSPEGSIPTHACPTCRARLEVADHHCAECGAPMYGVRANGAGRVEWCARKGCAGCRWDEMDARGPQPFVELSVEDTGCGIAPEHMDHLFDPFYSTKGSHGTGLGLAVTWGIVEAHAGSITVESEPGHGTCFTVQLPCKAPDSATGQSPAARTPMPDARGTAGGAPAAPIAPRAIPSAAPPAAPPTPDDARGAA